MSLLGSVLRIEPANKLIREYQKTLNQFIEQSKERLPLLGSFPFLCSPLLLSLEKHEAKNGDSEDDEEDEEEDDEDDGSDEEEEDDEEEDDSEGETESKR